MIILPTKVNQYDVLVVKSLFCGDVFMQSGVLYLDGSGCAIETYTETSVAKAFSQLL